MSVLTCCGRSRWARRLLGVLAPALLVAVPLNFLAAQEARSGQFGSAVLEEKFPFPPPLQWAIQNVEFSLISVAWGPANSPELISKGREANTREKAEFSPELPYAVAMCLQAVPPRPINMIAFSGLVRIKDIEGTIQFPTDLTPSGFVNLGVIPAGVNDLPVRGTAVTEHCDFFPVPADQREFLFEVRPPSSSTVIHSFRVLVKGSKLVIINVAPTGATPLEFTKTFNGTVGAESQLTLQLKAKGSDLSGTEQYEGTGKTLWLAGKVDSLGNFDLEESCPKDQVTGKLHGKFSSNYREMTGYFSKPDGSALRPFTFREVQPPLDGQPPCPAANTPSGWSTYINRTFGFCFSYPPTYKPAKPWLPKYTNSGAVAANVHKAVEEEREAILEHTQFPDVSIQVYVGSGTFDLQSLVKHAPTGYEDPPEPREFGDNTFYFYGPGGGGVAYPDEYFYSLKGRTLYITFDGPYLNDKTPPPETKSMEGQLLGTFRTF